jgi:predicted GNAT family N-acyltransferase
VGSADRHDTTRSGLRVRRLADAGELALALALRERVFCGEQGVSLAAEQDGRDPDALHLGAFDDGGDGDDGGGALVGTCRLLGARGAGAELVVQRVAVDPDRRRRGVGRALIAGALAEARARGVAVVSLHAQLESEAFYAGLGFVRSGQPFLEEGIEHVAMRRDLGLS